MITFIPLILKHLTDDLKTSNHVKSYLHLIDIIPHKLKS